MYWEVRGTKDGKPIRAKVAAGSEDSARKKAEASGVVVKAVLPLESGTPGAQAPAPPAPPPPAPISAPIRFPPAHATPESDPLVPPADAMASPEGGETARADDAATAPPSPPAAMMPYATPMHYATPMQGGNRLSGFSITSLCCGCGAALFAILSFCLLSLPISILAGATGIVFGALAWSSAKKSGNARDRKMAMAGTFTSIGAIVLAVIMFSGFWMFIRSRTRAVNIAAQQAQQASVQHAAQPSIPQTPALLPTPPAPPPPPPPRPSAQELAAKLQKINTSWQPSNYSTTELLALMKPRKASRNGDNTVIHRGGQLQSTSSYRPPVNFQVVALSDEKDTRIAYGGKIIFNWEMGGDDLRIDSGPASGKHKAGAGRLPNAQWAGIELAVRPTEMIIYVDGVERQRIAADFSKVNDHLTIEAHGGDVQIKSVTVAQP